MGYASSKLSHNLPPVYKCIFSKTADKDVWDNINTDKLRDEYYKNSDLNSEPIEDLNYALVFLLIRKEPVIIPLTNKYEGKYLFFEEGEKWITKELVTYLQHYLPWKFTITPIPEIPFGGGAKLGGWFVSRIIDPVISRSKVE